jgi:hypothetical protein
MQLYTRIAGKRVSESRWCAFVTGQMPRDKRLVYAHGNKAYGRSIILIHECVLPIMVGNKQVRAWQSVEGG